MLKAEDEGVQGLPWQELEAVVHKLLVFGECCSLQYLVATVCGIVEEGMADVFHVGANLVGAAGLKHTFHQCYISESFQHSSMGDGMLPDVGVVIYGHHATVFR